VNLQGVDGALASWPARQGQQRSLRRILHVSSWAFARRVTSPAASSSAGTPQMSGSRGTLPIINNPGPFRTGRARFPGSRLKQAPQGGAGCRAGFLRRWALALRWQGACIRTRVLPVVRGGGVVPVLAARGMSWRVTLSHQCSQSSGEAGRWLASMRRSPHDGQRLCCLPSRRKVPASSGMPFLRRRFSQYPARSGSSGDATTVRMKRGSASLRQRCHGRGCEPGRQATPSVPCAAATPLRPPPRPRRT